MAVCICIKKLDGLRVASDGLNWQLLGRDGLEKFFGRKNEYVRKRKYLPARSRRWSDRNL